MVSNIRDLLEKYWEGETSIEEEQALVLYFNQDVVDETLKQYVPLFQLIKHTSAIQPSLRLDQKLKDITIRNKEIKTTKRPFLTLNHYSIRWAIAASVLLLVGIIVWSTVQNKSSVDLYADTFSSPEEALEFIKETLEDLSYQVNLSTTAIEEEMIKISQLNEITQ